MVEEWQDDRTKPNPYSEPVHSKFSMKFDIIHSSYLFVATTIQDIRLELAKEDANDTANGNSPAHETSVTMFLTKGLELESQQ